MHSSIDKGSTASPGLVRAGLSEPQLETLCDVAAAELLLPRRHALDHLAHAPFGWATVQDAADTYEASLDATARRWVTLSSPGPALLLDLRAWDEQDEPGAKTARVLEPQQR